MEVGEEIWRLFAMNDEMREKEIADGDDGNVKELGHETASAARGR